MSRSKRKPIATQGYGGIARRFFKKLANKKAAKEDLPDGMAYKRTFNSWDICDYKFDITMPKGKSKTAKKIRAKATRK